MLWVNAPLVPVIPMDTVPLDVVLVVVTVNTAVPGAVTEFELKLAVTPEGELTERLTVPAKPAIPLMLTR